MMGKRSTRDKDGDTRVLFKKSQHTIYTQSRTCSGISQINTRSGVIQIKKKLSQHQYYVEGEKVKRDLSTETGICILRRYYKKKKNRMSTQEGSKSRYSTVNTEIDTIEEFRQDTATFGSEVTERNNERDICKMMVDNFKYLLNNWIEKYLLDSKDTKEKSESVLYSLLHRTELDRTSTSSSRSTYVLNREHLSQEVKNKKVEATSIICQYCQNQSWTRKSRENSRRESSCHSTPTSHKNIKLISTLSIPKNLHKKDYNKNDKSNHKIRKSRQRNLVLSINKPSKLHDFSSFDLLTIPTKSFTKRCATYDCDGKKKKRKKKRHIVFLPKPFYKSATDSTSDDNKHKTREANKATLDPMPSLMKSIYGDDPANITSTDDNIYRNENFTMTNIKNSQVKVVTSKGDNIQVKDVTDCMNACESVFLQESTLNEEDRSDPMMAIDFINESIEFTKQEPPKKETICAKTKATDTNEAKIENTNQTKSRRKNGRRVLKSIKAEKKRMRIKRYKRSHISSQNFLEHCQNILQYFADYENNINKKLDIHITVLPVNNFENKSTFVSRLDLNTYEKSETLVFNTAFLEKPKLSRNSFEGVDNIIPLLDGAINQSNYLLKSESCSEKTVTLKNNLTIDRSTITDAEIKDDINELKSIIKDLTKAAEAFVKEHVKKETKLSQCDNHELSKLENLSEGIQFSNEISKKPILSSIKLSNEPPKKDVDELYYRLMRKSTSYNIIDSESILRVTDMTSAANEIHQMDKSVKSLPNSRSMVKNSDIHKNKLISHLYDEYNKNDFIYNISDTSPGCPKMWLKLHKNKQACNPEPCCIEDSSELIEPVSSHYNECISSANDDDLEKCSAREPVCRREGMGFGEGCIYCMLMWIPVVLIAKKLANKMQSIEENKTSKRRPKSQTRYPKKLPSYVVAFSLKETYDDLVTAQQMICNKRSPHERSPQESTNSITPTNSLKMFETEQAEKKNQILAIPEAETKRNIDTDKNSPHESMNSMESMTPTNSLKYLGREDISDTSLITIGEQENISIDLTGAADENYIYESAVIQECDVINENTAKIENVNIDEDKISERVNIKESDENALNNVYCSEKLTNKAPEIDNLFEAENKKGDQKDNPKKEIQDIKIETSNFKAAQNNRKYKKRRVPKRKPNTTFNIKQRNFKYKNPKKVIDNRLEKYYEKRSFIDADRIQKELYSDEVSTVVSRTRVLHKIIARENLHEESGFISFINDVGLNEYDSESLSSSLSTIKRSIISETSQDTLTQVSSMASKNEDDDVETINSVIKIPRDHSPYKTDVINVAVAVAYDRSKVNAREETVPIPSDEKFMILGSLTSSEMENPFFSTLTSDSAQLEDFRDVTIETSAETLVNKRSSFGVSSNDFVIARTSSDFTKSSDESTFTLKNNAETVVDIETIPMEYPEENTPTLLETVLNLGIYPEMTPSTSSDTQYKYNYNDVIIAKNLGNKYAINSSQGDNKEQELSKHVLKKTINQQKEKMANRTIYLPNQADIKALLKENDIPQLKCAEESRHPSYLPEMWDRLVMTLDIAVKRLENNLVEKIVKELKNVLGPIPKDIPTETKTEVSKEVAQVKLDTDQGQQCDLVKNTIIDQIMRKLSIDGPKIIDPDFAYKTLQKTKLFKDFEVLKPPEVSEMMAEKDTVTVSTITYEVCNFRRLRDLFAVPVNFIRENVLVITSVPTFFVVLLCIYGMILLFMKPW